MTVKRDDICQKTLQYFFQPWALFFIRLRKISKWRDRTLYLRRVNLDLACYWQNLNLKFTRAHLVKGQFAYLLCDCYQNRPNNFCSYAEFCHHERCGDISFWPQRSRNPQNLQIYPQKSGCSALAPPSAHPSGPFAALPAPKCSDLLFPAIIHFWEGFGDFRTKMKLTTPPIMMTNSSKWTKPLSWWRIP